MVSNGARKRLATEESSENSTIYKPPEPKIPKITDCDVTSLLTKDEGCVIVTVENISEVPQIMDSSVLQTEANEHSNKESKEVVVEGKDANSVITTETDSCVNDE